MKSEKIPDIRPTIRFSEFVVTSEWRFKPFSEVYTFKSTNSLSRDQLNYKNGLAKNIHYGDIHTKFSPLFNIENENVPYINPSVSLYKIESDNYCKEGDVIFADASEDLKDVGKSIEIVNLNNNKVLSGLHTILARQIQNDLIVGFGGYLFQSSRIRFQIRKESQGTKVFSISPRRLSNIQICFPSDKNEQQNIVDCLTSLDELITAENQKLHKFKMHKKGLMQQLFPAEGETLPQLRFPEFRYAPEWEERQLSQLTTKISDGIHTTPVYVENGEYAFINGNNLINGKIVIDEKTKRVNLTEYNKHKKPLNINSILLSINGTIGNLALFQDEQVILGKSACFINVDRKSVNRLFIYYIIQTDKINGIFNAELTGSTIKNLSLGTIKKLQLLVPALPEQQKIAACLSTLDEQIAVQSQKIDALKAQKKGLMQQLFPSVDEMQE